MTIIRQIAPLLILLVGVSHCLFDDDDDYIIEYVPHFDLNKFSVAHQNRLGINDVLEIWDRSDDDDDRPVYIIEQESFYRTPKTIIAVMNTQMSGLLPGNEYNPFYDDENGRLRTEFILDQLSTDKLDLHDLRLHDRYGLHMRAMSGDDYIFRTHPLTGVLSLNGVDVESFEHFDDDTDVIVLSDFLYNHRQDIRRAKANPPPVRKVVDRHGRPIGKPRPKNTKRPDRNTQVSKHQSASQRFAQAHHHGRFPFPGILIARELD